MFQASSEGVEGQDAAALELSRAISAATDGDYKRALSLFSEQLAQSPKDARLLYFVGLCHHFLQEDEKAEEYLKESLSLEPSFPEVYYWYGRLLADSGEWSQAGRIVESGLRRFPRNEKLNKLQESLVRGLGEGRIGP